MWFGGKQKLFPFLPHPRSRNKKPRTDFWKPLTSTQAIHSKIHNLSKHSLTRNETRLLNLGLKYIPPSPPPTPNNILKEFTHLSRSLKLKHFFRNTPSLPLNPFKLPNPNWMPPIEYPPLVSIIEKHQHILNQIVHNTKPINTRIPYHLSSALKSLQHNHHIIILPSDKNMGVCVLDKDTYYTKAIEHLSNSTTYKRVSHFPLEELVYRLNNIITNHLGTLSLVEVNFILHKPKKGYQVSNLYFLPKLHKTPMGFRPICSYKNSLFEQTSKWLHHQLLPILLQQPQYLKDSHTLIQSLENLHTPSNSFLFTFDVESLYPSIPPKIGLQALRSLITPHFSPSKTNLIYTLSALVLEYHYLTFDGVVYQQIKGTAMGSNFSVVYACLFLVYLENLQPPPPHLFYFTRYIDDAFGVWTGTKSQLLEYLDFYPSNTNNSIKLTIQTSPYRLPFLDIWINLENSSFSFNCFQKPLNSYQYLPFSSNHPSHTKQHFITNEVRRYLIRESTPLGFYQMKKLFFIRLVNRGYPPSFILKAYRKIPFNLRKTLLYQPKTTTSLNPTIFKLRYTKHTPKLGIHSFLKNLYNDLMLDPNLISIARPFICWTKSKSIHALLVKTKFSKNPPKSPT